MTKYEPFETNVAVVIMEETSKNRTIGPWLIWDSCETRRISWLESGRFHGSGNLADFMAVKSGGFHVKSSGFHA